MYYKRKASLNLQTYDGFSLSGYGGRQLKKIETLKESTLLSLLKSTITCFGGIFER